MWNPMSQFNAQSSLQNHGRRWQASSGFTLAELLITIAIITLVLTLAVPLFNVISGARTVEAAQNVIAARIGQARTLAINQGRFTGVAFFRDPTTDRVATALVSFNNGLLDDPDTLNKYRGWFGVDSSGANATYERPNAAAATPIRGDRVLRVINDFRGRSTAGSWNFLEGKPSAYAMKTVPAAGAIPAGNPSWGATNSTNPVPPTNNTAPVPVANWNNGPSVSNIYWTEVNDDVGELDLVANAEADVQLLPQGVGMQVITSLVATSATAVNRYAGAGLILFDPNGQLVTRPYGIRATSPLSQIIFNSLPTATVVNVDRSQVLQDRPASSDLGIVLFDQALFRAAAGSQSDGQLNDFPAPDTTEYTLVREQAEETWLDNNGTSLLINRYSGAIGQTQ